MKRTALVRTENASRYLQQLSKHWAHKFEVDYSQTESRIKLPLGKLSMQASESALGLEVTSDTTDSLDQLCDVIERHIDRFAHRESALVYGWK
ncbi:DUF2218 domain-containing protein [Henriciella barbarensis]|uniref:DUF2218 domain-containing protein n=1 Tax=Henriciella barbarensis TaxID=86342 RepID=A0A399R0S7_9PROT|nr:DUF2218 domain-containing protein [Henriciella barbarensis]RIJ23362.1 DUF2218 domain-containing protein [Henriciella barbarensis]